MNKVSRILVCGGRNYKDYAALCTVMDKLKQERFAENYILIEGGAQGADSLARMWQSQHGGPCANVAPLWGRYGANAGKLRNSWMLLLNPELVVAFPGGNGTKHMCIVAEQNGVEVIHA